MDNNSSGKFEGEELDESNNMAQDDEDEGSDDERQTKHVKQNKAAKNGSYFCITLSDLRLMIAHRRRSLSTLRYIARRRCGNLSKSANQPLAA
jgi:hypothetical protein